jgi:hypothetical protein
VNKLRIYIGLLAPVITDKSAIYLLSYLKLRYSASISYGNIKRSEAHTILHLSQSTTKRHLNYLESHGYILCKGKSILVVSSTKLFDSKKKNHYVKVDIQNIMSYSWKNISEFKAYLVELINQKQANYKKALSRGFNKYDYRSKTKERIKDSKYVSFEGLLSLSCAAKSVGLSVRTIQRYREKQKVSNYSWKLEYIVPKASEDACEFYVDDVQGKGKHFIHKDKLYFSPISKRQSQVKIFYR